MRFADQAEYFATLERWSKARPASIVPLLAMADAYRGYAWDSRGTGFSSTVSETGMTDFERYIDLAWGKLQEALEIDQGDPELYRQLVQVGRNKGICDDELLEYFLKGVEFEPTYTPLFTAMASALLPKWYGSPGAVQEFTHKACEGLNGDDADELYARLSWFVYDDDKDDFFAIYEFDWERMKKGFATIERRHPGSRFNNSSFCRMATRARDREAAALYFSSLDGEWNEEMEKVWKSERLFAEYRAWAAGKGAFPGPQQIHVAVRNGDVQAVGGLIAAGADVDARSEDGLTPLILALENHESRIARMLLKAGAQPELTTDKGWYPIQSAANKGLTSMVKLLLESGCSPNSTDSAGWTPLHLAARNGSEDVVSMLIECANINIDPRDDRQKTPLHHAANHGHLEVAELLLGHSEIEVDARDKWGWTPLHYSARHDRVEVARQLLKAGADVNARNNKGLTPLKQALRREQNEIAALLRGQGATE